MLYNMFKGKYNNNKKGTRYDRFDRFNIREL